MMAGGVRSTLLTWQKPSGFAGTLDSFRPPRSRALARPPSLKAVAAWRDQTPKDFLFAWKASKFITHWKRLNENCPNSIELMETRLKVLSPKVGAVLFQLPPQFSKNRDRLASFLDMLPRCYPY